MKFVGSQIAYYLEDVDFKNNARTLVKYLALLTLIIIIYSILFQVIMVNVEGKDHSWITGFYWTLTVMSTLGFGDITFQSDIGRLFSMLVLLSGIFMLLIVLPFAFIRYFYVPLIESRNKVKIPKKVPDGMKDHVIICSRDAIARDLTERLGQEKIPYFIIEIERI